LSFVIGVTIMFVQEGRLALVFWCSLL